MLVEPGLRDTHQRDGVVIGDPTDDEKDMGVPTAELLKRSGRHCRIVTGRSVRGSVGVPGEETGVSGVKAAGLRSA